MVWTKSSITSYRAAGDANSDSGTARNNDRSECCGESFRFSSTSHRNPAGANAAARISEGRAQGSAGDY